jgi:succinoglycan biosynthesis protein ExoO
MTVTVLIPAYNAEPFLHRAIESALGQTLPVTEVIVVNDASTDTTAAVVKKFAAADPRVKLINMTQNSGPSLARNAGLAVAKTDWIAILDADDAFLPTRLEHMMSAALRENADIVCDNFSWYDAHQNKIGDSGMPPSDKIETVSLHQFVAKARPYTGEADWGLFQPILKRSFLQTHNLQYPNFSRHGEDYLFMLNLLMAGARYVLVHDPGYLYTHRSSGFSRTRIDYESMKNHTAALLTQDNIKSDPLLQKLLRDRVKALQKLAMEYKLRPAIDNRRYSELIQLAFSGPPAWSILAPLLWRKALSCLR